MQVQSATYQNTNIIHGVAPGQTVTAVCTHNHFGGYAYQIDIDCELTKNRSSIEHKVAPDIVVNGNSSSRNVIIESNWSPPQPHQWCADNEGFYADSGGSAYTAGQTYPLTADCKTAPLH